MYKCINFKRKEGEQLSNTWVLTTSSINHTREISSIELPIIGSHWLSSTCGKFGDFNQLPNPLRSEAYHIVFNILNQK